MRSACCEVTLPSGQLRRAMVEYVDENEDTVPMPRTVLVAVIYGKQMETASGYVNMRCRYDILKWGHPKIHGFSSAKHPFWVAEEPMGIPHSYALSSCGD